jgi:hypothetical protein
MSRTPPIVISSSQEFEEQGIAVRSVRIVARGALDLPVIQFNLGKGRLEQDLRILALLKQRNRVIISKISA